MKYESVIVRKRGEKWQAMLEWHDENGKRRYTSKTLPAGTDKYGAKKLANEYLQEMNLAATEEAESGGGIDLGRTVADYMQSYVEALKESNSLEHSTIVGYGTSLGYVKRELSEIPVVALTPARVQRFVNALNKQGYSPSTVRKAYMLLNQGMDQAVRDGYLAKSPCDRKVVRLPKKKFMKPNALDERGRARLMGILSELERTPSVMAAYIALYTGMRQGEIAGLRWRAIDFRKRTIHVCEAIAVSGEGGTYSKSPKTNQDRYIPTASGLEVLLREWQDRQRDAWRQANPDWEDKGLSFEDTYVVGHEDGRWRNPHTIGKDWTVISRLYGLRGTQGRNVTFHDLRHTFATAAISKGADIRSVSDILGHENVAMTLNIYADADPHAKRRTIDMMDDELTQSDGDGEKDSR